MTLFKKNGKKIHFVHIPKSGGSAVIQLLKDEGWEYSSPPGDLWETGKMEGHPQKHIWEKWDEAKDVDFRFTLIRNPYDRDFIVFGYNKI